MRRLVLAFLSLALLAACQPTDAALSEEDVAAVSNLATSYYEAVRTGDADGVAQLFSEDADWLPQNDVAHQGRAAVRTFHEIPPVPDLVLTSIEVDGRSGLAFDRGTWSRSMPDADTTVAMTGKYLAVARKQTDGAWLWTELMWNTDIPMPQQE